jgi:hypothetical protein
MTRLYECDVCDELMEWPTISVSYPQAVDVDDDET